MAAQQLPEPRYGAALRAARTALSYSQTELAREVNRLRERRSLDPLSEDSARQQISRFERDVEPPGPLWRSLLAEALQVAPEQLFGMGVAADLPQPLLSQVVVTESVVEQVLAQRLVHARAEHMFGPRYAQALVDRDLATIQQLIRITPPTLRRDARQAAALVAELGGWIAQDSGDLRNAARLTKDAEDHARSADPRVRAMILMRRSNILTGRDPDLAVELATAAADLITGLDDVGRLAASIARQQARAALAINDADAFREHAWYAAELAAVEPVDDDLASYATPAYIASETATGLVVLGQADEAVELLQPHVTAWPDGQRRDHAVAHARLLRALVAVGEYPLAVERSTETLRAYRAAPSDRARVELRRLGRLINDRRRTNRGLHLDAIRVRIAKTLQGDDPDA